MEFRQDYRSLLINSMLNRFSQVVSLIRPGLVLAGCFWLIQSLAGQPEIVRFQRLTDEEGLPNNLFRKAIQDRDGLFWMSSFDGIARYDGYTIQSFRHNHGDSTTISSNNVTEIYEDSKGRLWIGTLGFGLNVSNIEKTSFRKIRIHEKGKEIYGITPHSITEDSLGNIWLVANLGLFILREKEGQIIGSPYMEAWKALSSFPELNNATNLYTDKEGRVWIGTETGLYRFDVRNGQMQRPEDFHGLPHLFIQNIESDRQGRIWVSGKNKGPRLYFTSMDNLQFTSFEGIPFISSTHEVFFTFDLDNRIWATVFAEQTYGYDFRDSTLFLQSSLNSDMRHERYFRQPLVDHSGNVWLPVEGFYIYPYPKGFHTYFHPYAFHQSNSCIYGQGNDLWLGYREKGLVRLNKRSGETVLFSKENARENFIPSDAVQAILKVKSGNLILVGFANVAVMDPRGKILASHNGGGTLRGAFEDSAGRIWIGGYGGLHLFSERKGVLKTYPVPGKSEGEAQYIQNIVEDARGYIWFSSDANGLCRLDPASEKIIQFLRVEGDTQSLPSVSVVDMALDARNNLWLGTDVGLVRFDPVTFGTRVYDSSYGLENDFIAAVITTPDGKVWVSTHSGIAVFDPVQEKFVSYNHLDGLSNFSYYRRSVYYDPDGRLFFGGKNGVDYFHPDHLRSNPTTPRMFISRITVNNKEEKSVHDLDSSDAVLQLSFNDKVLEIEITGLHFAEQEAVRYAYKMEGMSEEWIDLGTHRRVLFSSLRPGNYVFRAKAISGDQLWSDQEIILPIHVAPPFYLTSWFQIAAIILIIASLFTWIKWRERNIKKKQKSEAEFNRKIAELEKRALQAQMNPHFIYNSMNSIQQFMIIHDIEGAMKYLTKFSRILRTVLNISAQSRIPLYDEIKLIEDYLELENMRFPDKFTYTIHVSPAINIHAVEIPPFFIQPQVENAIRHGLLRKATQGHLRIEIHSEDQHLHIVVEDNGIGREAAQAAKYKSTALNESKGLSIVEERLSHLHSGNGYKPFKIIDLYDNANRPAGTRVEITLPLED